MAVTAERDGFKPNEELGERTAFAEGNDISTLIGAALLEVPAVVPTAVLIWARA